MNTTIAAISLFFVLGGVPCFSTENFQITTSSPRLRIKSVQKSTKLDKALELSVEIVADGITPVALSQKQITVSIHTENEPYLFRGNPTFPKAAPKIFTVTPKQPLPVSFTVSKNKFEPNQHWSKLPKGNYTLRVYVNSGKSTEFDYHWLGQTYSDDFKLTVD